MISRLSIKDPGFIQWPVERGPFYGDDGVTVFAVVFDHDDEYQPDGTIILTAEDVKPAPWMPDEFARYVACRDVHAGDDTPLAMARTLGDLLQGTVDNAHGIDVVAAVLLGVAPAQPWWYQGYRAWAEANPGRGADQPSWVATYDDLTAAGRALVDALARLGDVRLITATDT